MRCIGKGDKERIVPVGRKALAMVEKYLQEARPELLRQAKAIKSTALFVNRRGVALSRVGVWKILSALWPASRLARGPDAAYVAA